MNLQIIFLEEFGKAFIPKRIRQHLRAYFMKAGLDNVPYKLFGAIFYLSLIATFACFFAVVYPHFSASGLAKLFAVTVATWIVLPLCLVAVMGFALYLYLDQLIFNRTRKMEDVLQDFLRFVVEDLKGGMPFERALWSAIRPEFGILSSEVRLAAKRVMTGEDMDEAISEFTSKYDSPILKRTFDLIVEGLKGGSSTADMIERLIENIEQTKELKGEMVATNMSYVIFVSFIVILIAPLLFALSFQFLLVLKGFSSRLSGTAAGVIGSTMPIGLAKSAIKPESFKQFSLGSLTIIATFAGVITSIINTGSVRGGIKYIPLLLIGAILMYIFLLGSLTSIFGGFAN